MNRTLLAYVFSLSLALVLATPVVAQRNSGGGGGEMLQAALEQTDQLIDRSAAVIQASGSDAAMKAFESARELQKQAWDRFNEGTVPGNVAARVLTMSARDQVRVALRLVAPGGSGNELEDGAVQRKLDRAGDKLDRAGQLLNGPDNANLDALYQGARNTLDQAWEFYRSKQYRPALKLADQVEMAAERIMLLVGENNWQGEGNFDRRHDNVGQIIDQVGQMIQDCQSEAAHSLLDQARQSFDLAESLNDKNQAGAMQALRTARDLALKAERTCRGNAQLEQRFQQLTARLERVTQQAESLTGSTKETVDRLLGQAKDQLALARGYLDQNQPAQAQAALQATSLAIQQAEGYIQERN